MKYMTQAVTKEVTFDCAHMLSGHKGLCSNLHGHTYKLLVTVNAELIDLEDDQSSAGMVIDFADLKRVIEDVVMKRFDHAVIFSAAKYRGPAEDALLDWASTYDKKFFVLPNTRVTAENMAMFFVDEFETELNKKLGRRPCFCNIKLYETPTSYAEV